MSLSSNTVLRTRCSKSSRDISVCGPRSAQRAHKRHGRAISNFVTRAEIASLLNSVLLISSIIILDGRNVKVG